MNLLERGVDGIDPRLSVTLRGIKSRLQRRPVYEVIRRFVGPGQCVVDIGANRGVYTWLMSRQVGTHGRVHSIEPYPANVDRLSALAASRRNVVVHAVALSDSDGQATLRVPTHHHVRVDALASLRPTFDHSFIPVQVEKRRLDDLIPPDENTIHFVKCDVEGHEDEVIDGSWTTITQNRPVMAIEIEQRHRATPVTDLIDRIVEAGYDCFFLDDEGAHPISEFDVERDQMSFHTDDFVPNLMPKGYINNFLFVPTGRGL